MRLHFLILVGFLGLIFSSCSTDDPTRNNTFVPLTSIEVTATYPTMAEGTVNQYIAIGNFSGQFERDITTEVSWSIEDETIATISSATGSEGLVTAVSAGQTVATAFHGDISGSAPVIVTDVSLSAIEISPQDVQIQIDSTQQFEATGIFSDSSSQDITPLATWDSSDDNVAIIGSTGLATSLATGITTISAAWQSIQASTSLTVTDVSLTSISIAPDAATIAQGTTVQFQVEGTYSDGSTADITNMVTWQSSDNNVSTVDTEGLAEGIGAGQAEISATLDLADSTLTATALITVTDAHIIAIIVTPESATISVGSSQKFTATGRFSDNSEQDITELASWSSSINSVGTISNTPSSKGLFTSQNIGNTIITATFDGVSGETVLSVQ